MSTNPTTRIAERRKFIVERTAQLQAELETLQAEAGELETAERVLERFTEAPAVGGRTYRATAAEVNGHTDDPGDHDEAHLTLPQMVFRILEEAKAAGRKGVEGAVIVTTIKSRWKPDWTSENVRPTLWRMSKKEGRLKKRGKLYMLPTPSPEGETEAVGASVRH